MLPIIEEGHLLAVWLLFLKAPKCIVHGSPAYEHAPRPLTQYIGSCNQDCQWLVSMIDILES